MQIVLELIAAVVVLQFPSRIVTEYYIKIRIGTSRLNENIHLLHISTAETTLIRAQFLATNDELRQGDLRVNKSSDSYVSKVIDRRCC